MQNRLTADALDAVERLCRDAGWTIERVGAGDDVELLARIPSNCKLPPVPLWLAVQGTHKTQKYRQGDDTFVVPVAKATALRWFERRAATLAVLWDLDDGKGYWTLPRHYLPELDLLTGMAGQGSLVFVENWTLPGDDIERFARLARVLHIEELLATSVARDLNLSEGVDLSDVDEEITRTPFIILEFLTMAGAFRRGLQRHVREAFREELADLVAQTEEELKEEGLTLAEVEDELALDEQAAAKTFGRLLTAFTADAFVPLYLAQEGPLVLIELLEEAGDIAQRGDEA
jgi:hypothetical protein